jgi:hypothetical protein
MDNPLLADLLAEVAAANADSALTHKIRSRLASGQRLTDRQYTSLIHLVGQLRTRATFPDKVAATVTGMVCTGTHKHSDANQSTWLLVRTGSGNFYVSVGTFSAVRPPVGQVVTLPLWLSRYGGTHSWTDVTHVGYGKFVLLPHNHPLRYGDGVQAVQPESAPSGPVLEVRNAPMPTMRATPSMRKDLRAERRRQGESNRASVLATFGLPSAEKADAE